LQSCSSHRVTDTSHSPSTKDTSPIISKNEGDYFSLAKTKDPRAAIMSPVWPRLPSTSPTTASYAVATSLSLSNSSRGSWSSLFNTGSVRQFMSGVHESISTPLDTLPGKISISIPHPEPILRLPNIDAPRQLRMRDQAPSVSPISKSWSETQMASNRQTPFPIASHGRRPERSQAANAKQIIQEKKLIVLEEESQQFAQGYVPANL
jgi:WD repeat-containing protein 59